MSASSDTIVRAADYLPTKEEIEEKRRIAAEKENDPTPEPVVTTDTEDMLLRLFGDLPDYGDNRMEHLWQRVHEAEPEEMIAYARSQGVDITGSGDQPVTGWRDIVVMLMAREKGILESAG